MSALFHPYLCGRKAAEWLINMTQIIMFVEENVAGTGENAEVIVAVHTDFALSHGHQIRLKNAIANLRQEIQDDEWDTDFAVGEAMKEVFGDTGYEWEIIIPDLYVEF